MVAIALHVREVCMGKGNLRRLVSGIAIAGITLGALVAVLLVLIGNAQTVSASSLPTIQIQPPGSGYWDRFGLANPATHHIIYGADWATDFYMSPGSTVRVRAYPAYQVGSVKYHIATVGGVTNTCRVGYAGKTVKVEFYFNGVLVGWAAYAHLDRVPVWNSEWVPHATLLGYTRQWTYSSCYQVSKATGVHVHFELYTRGVGHYACWYARPAGTWVNYWGKIGRIGGNTPTTKRSCP
jgi:hypothetical protein